jgi:hypothetical protein
MMRRREHREILSRVRRLWLVAALVLALLPSLQGCGDDEAEPIGPGSVTELEILLDEAPVTDLELAVGERQDIEVAGLDSQGRDNEDAEITASTSDDEVAAVTGTPAASRVRLAHTGFELTGISPGTATITFREEHSGVTADLEVTVTVAP